MNILKKLAVISCFYSLSFVAFAGNEGGGGHLCKSQAALYFENVIGAIHATPDVLQKYPEWNDLQFLMNPTKNPGFKIEVSAAPIKDCPNTQNALACGRPVQNKIQIHCGEDGWNSLEAKEKYKQIIHEAYWWSNLDDSNYYYSRRLLEDIYETIHSTTSIRQSFIQLKEGDIKSLETTLNSIGRCSPENLYSNWGSWKMENGSWVCHAEKQNPFKVCSYDFSLDYSIVINKTLSIGIKEDTRYMPGANQGALPVGTVFSEEACKADVRKNIYPHKSLEWFRDLSIVQDGRIQVTGKGSNKSCDKTIFQGSYDPTSGLISGISFERVTVSCP
jgi:hypothetical protein